MKKYYTKKIHLLFFLFISVLPGISHADSSAANFIDDLRETFKDIETYTATLKAKDGKSETIIRYYYKKPGFIKMGFVKPHNGASLIYSPHTGKVALRPFKSFESIVMHFDPDFGLITDPNGHTIDKSDIGSLLENVKALSDGGHAEFIPSEGNFIRIMITGKETFEIDGVNTYKLKIDPVKNLPVHVKAFDHTGRQIEDVVIDDLRINEPVPDSVFTPDTE